MYVYIINYIILYIYIYLVDVFQLYFLLFSFCLLQRSKLDAVTHWVEWLEQFLNMFKQNEGAPGIIEFIDVELSSSALRMFGCLPEVG